ncbi:MAG: N(4)-(beta-N-acetylglucosaminyl)-L-asparaginase [Gemmatimonadetes bacterium]|nr:N(4)-(beta-N-acetylglucosaminyl)-L-asparaginase [Gemmatimonadota bacterium]
MTSHPSRRDFLLAGAAALPLAGQPVAQGSHFTAPAVIIPPDSPPTVVASANGIRGVARAMELITQGVDTLDAIVEAVKIQELDPEDNSVGYGGLPNADGVVQLDASCMHGPTKRAGAVAALEGIKTPSEVAKLVLRYTKHILLVGEGAQRFALQFGFRIENLLTEESRQAWLRWRANLNPDDNYLDVPSGERFPTPPTGTINCCAVNARGEISSVTTTSGLAWKIPGRVGDSPIIGAGEYTDNDVGAAGSTGLGEANMKVCGAFLTVEGMRRGLSPTDACLETLRRVVATTEQRRLDPRGRPRFDLTFYALNKRGQYGCASMYAGYRAGHFAVHDGSEARLVGFAHLYEGEPPS